MTKGLTLLCILVLIASAFGQNRVLYGMGSNSAGQLAQNDPNIPSQLYSQLGGDAISFMCTSIGQLQGTTGVWRVVVINKRGKVYGWGKNSGGSLLGLNNTKTDEELSTPCLIYDLQEEATSLTCGDRHTIIQTASKKVYGFGENDNYQFGQGNTNPLSIATRLSSLDVFAKIWAVGSTTIGLTATNNLYGWGNNYYGQLGTQNQSTSIPIPLKLPNTIDTGGSEYVVQVGGTINYLFYVTNANNLYAAGLDNSYYSLGLNPQAALDYTFKKVSSDVSYISTQGSTSVAISGDKTKVYGWGQNPSACLCMSTTSTYSTPTVIPSLSGQTFKITQVALSLGFDSFGGPIAHGMYVTDSGLVFGCGNNVYNQLGIDAYKNATAWISTTLNTATPIVPTNINSNVATGALGLQLSSAASFLLTSTGSLYGWGAQNNLGVPDKFPSVFQINSTLTGLTADKIYVGDQFSIVYNQPSGKYYIFGENSANLIMSPAALDVFSPIIFSAFNNFNITNFAVGGGNPTTVTTYIETINIFGLANGTLARSQNGFYGMGSNDIGQLAQGTESVAALTPFIGSPIPISGSDFSVNATTILKIDAGVTHAGLLTGSNSLYMWGANTEGQLGLLSLRLRQIMIRVNSFVVDFSLGDQHSVYILKTTSISSGGTVVTYDAYGAGLNMDGQLGIGPLYRTTSFLPVGVINDTKILTNMTMSKVWTGSSTTWIMTSKGLYVMGANDRGQLGLNHNSSVNVPTLHPFFKTNVIQVSGAKFGGKHTMVLLDNGDVYAMGSNDKGQLGLSDRNDRLAPTLVPRSSIKVNGVASTTDVIEVQAGSDHTLMVVGSKPCPNNCFGQGVCNTVTGVCACFAEFLGTSCELYQCPDPLCSLHGYCDTTRGVCVCTPSSVWKGLTCSDRRCRNDCSGRGICLKESGTCSCDKGYTGEGCDIGAAFSNTPAMWTTLLVIFVIFILN
ncbi:ultraviolet-B receptor [Acrasis kona]|uniref:Ultraviolet-B receptor n=1 Tax=Acrasis kona TaxID=1008807 RepID=A0AAW2YX84_9EUKA